MAVYPHATQAQISATLPRKTSRATVWIVLFLGTVLAMAALGIVAYLMRPQPFSCATPVQCGTAPPVKLTGNPLPPPASYTSSSYGFSVEYPSDASPSQTSNRGVSWEGTYNEGPATWNFVGDTAGGRSPQQVASDIQQNQYPNAQLAYVIPDADVGYTPGYGAVYDLFVNDSLGQSVHQRLVVLSAVRGGIAVSFYGTGPFIQTSLSADGHPNPAETPLVHEHLFRQSIEAVTWPGEPGL